MISKEHKIDFKYSTQQHEYIFNNFVALKTGTSYCTILIEMINIRNII